MRQKNDWLEKNIGDIIYDGANTAIGIVAYKTSERIGVMAIDRKRGIKAFPGQRNYSNVSSFAWENYPGDDISSFLWLPENDYSGLQSTKNVVAQSGSETDYAAKYCLEYGLGGYEWYMPTATEIRHMWINKDLINTSLKSLGKGNWDDRQYTGGKDIECILSCTQATGTGTSYSVLVARLNENGRKFVWSYKQYISYESWSGSYPAYSSVYPFFSIKI